VQLINGRTFRDCMKPLRPAMAFERYTEGQAVYVALACSGRLTGGAAAGQRLRSGTRLGRRPSACWRLVSNC